MVLLCISIAKILKQPLEIKTCIGLSDLAFGATTTEAQNVFGKAEETELLDDIESFQSTVWHYWDQGFSLFFDEGQDQLFCCVEIDGDNKFSA